MEMFEEFLNGLSVPGTFIALGLGILLMFFGYRVKKIAFFLVWFLLGYNLVAFFLPTICENFKEVAENEIYQELLPIGGGIVLGLLGFSIEKICVGGICFVMTMFIAITYFGTEAQVLVIAAIIGVILSGVGVLMMKPAIIVVTSLAGAYALAVSVLKLSGMSSETYYLPILVGGTVIGAVVQFLTTKRLR